MVMQLLVLVLMQGQMMTCGLIFAWQGVEDPTAGFFNRRLIF